MSLGVGNENIGISQLFYFRDIPSVTKDGLLVMWVWDIPNVIKDGLPEHSGEGLLCVITILQIITPPYGLIIDLSI